MQLKVLRTAQAWEDIANEWNHLLTQSASHVPFLRHEYLTAWWRILGGGEWAQGELFVVTARDNSGRLCGAAPLFFTDNLHGESALMLLGSIQISDFLDVLAPNEYLAPFLQELLAYLDGPHVPAWEVLDWYNLLENSPTLPALRGAADLMGWDYSETRLQPAPYVPLPSDWKTYLAGIKKKQRHEIRRKMRRAADYFIPVRWYLVEDEESLDDEIDALFTLMSHDPEKESFLTDPMVSQLRDITHAAFQANWLQLAFIEVGGKKAAAHLNFDFANRIWAYNSGIDFQFGELSPGWVLLSHLVQLAIEAKREVFDFMRGDETYKYRFGGINRHIMRVQVRR